MKEQRYKLCIHLRLNNDLILQERLFFYLESFKYFSLFKIRHHLNASSKQSQNLQVKRIHI